MLPPVLELVILWHPGDGEGADIAQQIFNHFMVGPTFSGIIGGGIHVSLRSEGWNGPGTAPRPFHTEASPTLAGVRPARYVAFVPLLGLELAHAVETAAGGWDGLVTSIAKEKAANPERVGIFPFGMDRAATDGTALGEILGPFQRIAASKLDEGGETLIGMLCRDLSQGLAQLLSADGAVRLTAFISHTKRQSPGEGEDVDALIEMVRSVIHETRLAEFFDASDLQPGTDWDNELRTNARTSALLGIRTDLYSSREWCQREVVIAKTSGMPVIMLDAMGAGEERGSFLMDHAPRVPLRKENGRWQRRDIYRGLNLLVDECLKRALWIRQKEMAQERPDLDVAWWAPHAPEPLTLLHWIEGVLGAGEADSKRNEMLRVLHPDPPLGSEEREVLRRYASLTRLGRDIDVMTPRQLATRGG